MTAKQKAEELVRQFSDLTIDINGKYGECTGSFSMKSYNAQECALIVVDEIIYNTEAPNKGYWLEVQSNLKSL